eukprot:CAMPEP_0184748642 /NCGR_PEP_ID=MMETSP0315-20130426/21407_1 /TAXON_ID=101924 /ORGANISM="Rhodosorus marinus, Strain UTEX LB 2760" /LENGTH=110 /DNA_ID=CAMNT_0027224315 /DNA_START=75 /DNA_END=407 /DNA_ORIENTATION=-
MIPRSIASLGFFRVHGLPLLRGGFRVAAVNRNGAWRRAIRWMCTESSSIAKQIPTKDLWKDGRYGKCLSCGKPVQFPGLSHWKCNACGWVAREDPMNAKGAKGEEQTDFK